MRGSMRVGTARMQQLQVPLQEAMAGKTVLLPMKAIRVTQQQLVGRRAPGMAKLREVGNAGVSSSGQLHGGPGGKVGCRTLARAATPDPSHHACKAAGNKGASLLVIQGSRCSEESIEER
jgi:hypothetical protein